MNKAHRKDATDVVDVAIIIVIIDVIETQNRKRNQINARPNERGLGKQKAVKAPK